MSDEVKSHGGEHASTVYRQLEKDEDSGEVNVAQVIAELEDTEPTNIPPIHNAIDSLIEGLFSSPPPEEAQAQLEFTYAGYRIQVNQDGHTTFLKMT